MAAKEKRKYRNINTSNSFSRNKGDILFYCLLLLIPLVQIGIFYFGVNSQSIVMAFQDYSTTENTFTWDVSKNFNEFASEIKSETFWKMVGSSFIVWFFTQFAGTVLALILSYYIYKNKPFCKFFKFVLFLPSIIPALLLVLVFKFFLTEAMPAFFGIDKLLLNKPETFFWIITGFTVWISFGSQVLVYTGAMSQVPEEIIEAGKIDGATTFREFISIIIPYIAPTIATFVIVGVATIFTNQNNLYSFYGNNIPDENFKTIGYYLYRLIDQGAYGMSKYCYASFVGLVSTFVAVPLTMIVRKAFSKVGDR